MNRVPTQALIDPAYRREASRHFHDFSRNRTLDGTHTQEQLPPLTQDPLSLTRRSQYRRLASPALHRALQERQRLLIMRKRVQAGVQKQVSESLVGTLRGSGVGRRTDTAGGPVEASVGAGRADRVPLLHSTDLLRWYSFNEARKNLLDSISQVSFRLYSDL